MFIYKADPPIDGIEYALIGAWDGTYIINITNSPESVVAFIPGSYSTHRDIKTYGNFLLRYFILQPPF